MTTVVCIGSGPSLTKEQVDRARQYRTVVINRSWELAPWADHLYIADKRAFILFGRQARDGGFTGTIWTPRPIPGAIPLQLHHQEGLNTNPGRVNCGGTGGYQAVNLAYHLGATRILLLGYDYQHTDGKSHWHGDHPEGWANMNSPEERGKPFIQMAKELAENGVELINCSASSSLKIKRGTL